MTRTILRLITRAIEPSADADDELVVVRTDEGMHRFQAIAADLTILRAHASTLTSVEIVVLADVTESGAIAGGEILEVVGPIEPRAEEAAQSGVVLRRTILDDDADDVDFAFDRIRNG